MGDVRNKMRKLEQRAAQDRWMAENCPERHRVLTVCPCGHNHHEEPLAQYQLDRWKPPAICCPWCAPDEVLAIMWPGHDSNPMCNLYSITKGTQAIRQLLKTVNDLTNGFSPLPAVFPNKVAPVVRYGADGEFELVMMRWGFPPPNIPGQKPRNPYLTNVRNTDSKYWRTYLTKPEQRCLVPVTSFAEPDNNQGPKSIWTWFAQDDTRPLFFFAGIWREWEGDRGTKTMPDVGKHLVFSFLTTDASHDVSPVHSDATPVCLFDEASRDDWMTAPWELACELQHPPAPGALKIVAAGEKQDPK